MIARGSRKWVWWFAIALAISSAALAIAWSIALPVFGFPQPAGPYSIGTLTYHWVDTNRAEVFSFDASARRELMVQVWYPAKTASSSLSSSPSRPSRAPYVQDGDALAKAFSRLTPLPQALFRQFRHVTTHAVPLAPVADDRPNYPVLLFLEGAIGFRQMNTFQVEALVSHGYIVVAIDQPYTAATVVFPDGREVDALPLAQMMPMIHQSYSPAAARSTLPPTLNGRTLNQGIIPYLAQDVIFTLDQLAVLNQSDPNALLTGRLDLQRVGSFGVSLGGIVGAQACLREPRLRACLFMDAPMPVDVVESGLQQSAMWITRDAQTMRLERSRSGGWPEAEIRQHLTSMRAVFNRMRGTGYFVEAPGMFHINLTDIPYWSPALRWLRVIGPMDAQRAHDIINAYSLAFFNRQLMDKTQTLLDGPASQYPEVILTTR